MRIIGGRLRRRTLQAPKGRLTRPSTDRVRESIFNLLLTRCPLEEARILDLFAGTGALGLEALSRGADNVLFVEQSAPVMRVLRKNAETLELTPQCMFVRGDAPQYLKRYSGPAFDVIFADPPYDLPTLPLLPALALPHLTPDGCFVLEHDVRHTFAGHPHLDTSRPYGRTIVSVFAHG